MSEENQASASQAPKELGRILVVESAPDGQKFLGEVLSDYQTLSVASVDEALTLLGRQPFDLVLSSFELPEKSGVELFKACLENYPDLPRVLWAPYEQLQAILKEGGEGIATQIVPKPGEPANLRKIIGELLAEHKAGTGTHVHPDKPPSEGALAWKHCENLIQWTALSASHVHDRVVRPLSENHEELQMQFVLPVSPGYEKFRQSVKGHWGAPLKERGKRTGWRKKKHPLIRLFKGFTKSQELYVREVDGRSAVLYLALLPWEEDLRITVMLGIHTTEFRPDYRTLLESVHREIIAKVSRFVVPGAVDHEQDENAQYLAEYKWVVSDDYVGPERRIKPTSLFNRFMFFGKRTFVPKGIQRFTDAFVDQMSPFVVRCFIAYVILSGIDGFFTYWLVGDGTVGEHNPLLRPLLGDSGNAWVFFLVKNVIVLGGYLLAARFQLFRVLKYVAPASVALYLFLDAYWLLILSRRFL